MAKIIPFKGLRYNSRSVDIEKVVAPPFDVISDEQRDLLYQRHPNNIVRLIKGKELPEDGLEENMYTRARQYLADWMATDILHRDEQPSIYVYEQQYQYSGDYSRTRRGFMALARLEDQDSGVILGHERTLMQPVQDRLNLLKECRANLSPIFSLFSQPEGSIDSILVEKAFTPSALEFWDDTNTLNRLWAVNDPAIIESLTTQMQEKSIIIADGHHRYKAALIYRHIRNKEKEADTEGASHNYVLMMFVNLDGEGVTIYPIHRIIYGIPDFDPALFRRKLEKYFEVHASSFDSFGFEETARNLSRDMARTAETRHTFGLYLGGDRLELLVAKDNGRLRAMVEKDHCESFKTLDVAIAQAVILQEILEIDQESISKEEHLQYTPSSEAALEIVRRGEAQIALLLNPTRSEQVKAITHEGEKMPQKSTFFYPKLFSGLVINMHDL